MPFDRLWDQADTRIDAAPKRTRWTLTEAGIAVLVVAVLAGTVLLAYYTGSPR